MLAQTQDIILQPGLFDEGDCIEFLLDLWPELQKSSADAARAPALDLFSFVANSFYFAVVYHKKPRHGGGFSPATRSPSIGADITNYASNQPENAPETFTLVPVGCVVLTSSSDTSAPSAPSGELSVSVIISEPNRRKSFARQTLELIMQWVFQDMHFHRLQAVIINGPWKLPVATLFIQLGFEHEGIRRRSIYSQIEGAWKDATYLAILDTDWFMRSYSRPAHSLWDEMLVRHDRERQALLRWEASSSPQCGSAGNTSARMLKRSGSVETVRALSEAPESYASTSASASARDARSDVSARGSVPPELQRLAILDQTTWERPLPRARSPSIDSSDMSVIGDSDIEDHHLMVDEWRASVGSPPPPSTPSDGNSERSASPESLIDSWDLLEDPFAGSGVIGQ